MVWQGTLEIFQKHEVIKKYFLIVTAVLFVIAVFFPIYAGGLCLQMEPVWETKYIWHFCSIREYPQVIE